MNTLYTGDNLYVLRGLDCETVDLIYLDPPFNSKTFYKAPILKINKKGEPEFRHLRSYLISAYERKGKSLTKKQLYALDVLDALLESSENQYRFYMNPGDLILALDAQILHGRTSFSDHYKAKTIFANNKPNLPLKRTMVRTWIQR